MSTKSAAELRADLQTARAQLEDVSQRLNRAERDVVMARDAWRGAHTAFHKAQAEAFEAWSREVTA